MGSVNMTFDGKGEGGRLHEEDMTKDGSFSHLITEKRTAYDYALATFIAISYPIIWIASVVSLIGLPIFLVLGWWTSAAIVLILGALSFIPHGNFPRVKAFYRRNFPNYFTTCDLRIEAGASLEPDSDPTVLCIHPHGIFSIGCGLLLLLAPPNMHFCFSPVLTYSPAFRIFIKMLGRPASASKENIKAISEKREPWAIIPGGFEEASIHCPGKPRVYLKERAGFIKYALMHGYSLTPSYAFGEENSFDNVQGAWKLRLWLNSLGIPSIFPWGVWWCPVLMRSVPILVAIGSPMKLPRIEKPSKEEVKKYHAAYIEHFVAFWNRNNPRPEEKLEVW